MNMTSQHRIRRMPRAAGFSLIEMLAVIVLIGIVAGIVVQQVGKNVDKGKYGAGKAQLTTLSQKLVTKKNAKMRRLRALHPGVEVKREGILSGESDRPGDQTSPCCWARINA